MSKSSGLFEVECCKCRIKLMRRANSDSYICDDCFDILQGGGGEEALAVKLERAAVVKYLRAVFGWEKAAIDAIERGEHIP